MTDPKGLVVQLQTSDGDDINTSLEPETSEHSRNLHRELRRGVKAGGQGRYCRCFSIQVLIKIDKTDII